MCPARDVFDGYPAAQRLFFRFEDRLTGLRGLT